MVAARKTRDPERIVPFATLAGTGATGLLYFFSCTAAMLLLPYASAAASTSPFADAISPTVGAGVGRIVAALTAVSALGALNASVLIQGEVGQQLAQAGDLPRIMARGNARLAPTVSLIVTSVISALFVSFNASRSFVGLYVFITLISTVASLVFYACGAVAALKLKLGGHHPAADRGRPALRDLDLLRRRARGDGVGLCAARRGRAGPALSRVG